MPDLIIPLANAFALYDNYHIQDYYSDTVNVLLGNLPQVRGVYVFFSGSSCVYIGSSGKYSNHHSFNGSTIRRRISSATIPYRFNNNNNRIEFNIENGNYLDSININEITIKCYATGDAVLPSSLEHLFIQCYYYEYNCLPLINREA